MKLVIKMLFLADLLMTLSFGNADVCDKWLETSNLKSSDSNCLSKCVSLAMGMNTFMCPQACPRFCKTSLPRELIMDLAYYPGLTKAERALIAEYPKAGLTVYRQMRIAEGLTLKYLRRSTQEDESDAFRHFVWASLLVMELDQDLAQKFLDAHEADPSNPPNDRGMDLANNRSGILEAGRLKKQGRLTQATIEEMAVEALRQNKLVVLKPQGGIQ